MIAPVSAKNGILLRDGGEGRLVHGSRSRSGGRRARLRFRPILMTSSPLASGSCRSCWRRRRSVGRISLGLSVLSGIIASTCLAVLFVPSFCGVAGLGGVAQGAQKTPIPAAARGVTVARGIGPALPCFFGCSCCFARLSAGDIAFAAEILKFHGATEKNSGTASPPAEIPVVSVCKRLLASVCLRHEEPRFANSEMIILLNIAYNPHLSNHHETHGAHRSPHWDSNEGFAGKIAKRSAARNTLNCQGL